MPDKERKKERKKERSFPKFLVPLQSLNFISPISRFFLVPTILCNNAKGKHGILTVAKLNWICTSIYRAIVCGFPFEVRERKKEI